MNAETTKALREFWSVGTLDAAKHERVTVPACPGAWTDEHQDYALTQLIGDAPIVAGMRILDYGCGVGRISRALLRRGAEVVAVDVAESMLGYAREHCGDDPRLSTILCDGYGCGDVASESVDGAVTAFCFQHFPTLDMVAGVLRDVYRVLRPNGWFVFQSTDHGLDIVDAPNGFLGARQKLATMLGLAEDAGFHLLRAAYPFAPGMESQYVVVLRRP